MLSGSQLQSTPVKHLFKPSTATGAYTIYFATDNEFMSEVAGLYNDDLYGRSLLTMVVRALAMGRWNCIHEGLWRQTFYDYTDFIAEFSYLLPLRKIDAAMVDYHLLYDVVSARWADHGYPDITMPFRYHRTPHFHIFEVIFDV